MKRALGARMPPRGGRPALHGFGVWGLGLRRSKAALAERAEGRRGWFRTRWFAAPPGTPGRRGLQTSLPSLQVCPGRDYTACCTGARQRVRGRRKGAGEPDGWPRAGPKVRGIRAAPDRKAVSLPARERNLDGSEAFGQSMRLPPPPKAITQNPFGPQDLGALIIFFTTEFSLQMSSLELSSGWIVVSCVLSHAQRRLLPFLPFTSGWRIAN